MNEAIQRFVDELAADPAVRGIILFGSHARGNARADSDADLVILGERDQFEMGFAERDGQKFELLRWSEAVAIRYAMDNRDNAADFWQVAQILYDPDGAAARMRDHAAAMLADGKPPMDEARRPPAWSCTNGSSTSRRRSSICADSGHPRRSAGRHRSQTSIQVCTVCSPRSTRTARHSRTSWRSPAECSRSSTTRRTPDLALRPEFRA
jgi:hypothetical protein